MSAENKGILSPRELQVHRLVARGLTNKRIAYELGIQECTVKAQLMSIFGKLGTTNRVQLALEWYGIVWRKAS